jgi:hypothetical protein
MTTQSKFSLRALVLDVLQQATDPNPGAVAEQVAAQIPDEHLRDALADMLRSYVREMIRSQRNEHQHISSSVTTTNRSWKRDGIRAGWKKEWQNRLRDQVHVGHSEWKFFEDCTYDDFMAAATERQEIAKKNFAKAAWYESCAEAILQHGVQKFKDLPVEVQASLLGGI